MALSSPAWDQRVTQPLTMHPAPEPVAAAEAEAGPSTPTRRAPKRGAKPLTMLPIPVLTVVDDGGAGPSTPTPAVSKRTRAGGKRAAKEVATAPAELSTSDDDEEESPRKKAKKTVRS